MPTPDQEAVAFMQAADDLYAMDLPLPVAQLAWEAERSNCRGEIPQ